MMYYTVIGVSAAIFFLSVFFGFKKGLLRTVYSILSFALTLVLVALLQPKVGDLLQEKTQIYEKTEAVMEKAIDGVIEKEIPKGMELTHNLQEAVIRELVPFPAVQEAISKNNNEEVYKDLGVDKFSAYLASYLAKLTTRAIAFVVTFLGAILIIWLVGHMLDILGELPGISFVNRLAGGAIGAARGILLLWILGVVVASLAGTQTGKDILDVIGQVPVLSEVYKHNLLLNYLIKLGILR